MPTFTERHVKITVMGDAWLATEQWQFGVNCRLGAGGDPTNLGLQTLANNLAPATQVFFATTQLRISSQARLTGIKAALIDVTGHYPATSLPGIYTYPTPPVGPSTGFGIPQATLAVTLLTNIPRGRGSRGRFYSPPVNPTLATDGRISVSDADNIEIAAKTWLNAITSEVTVDQILVMSGLGAGTTGVVDSIGVGRVVDTMRSRRRSLLEARTPLAL